MYADWVTVSSRHKTCAGFDAKPSSAVRVRMALLQHIFCNSSIDGNIHVAVDVLAAIPRQHFMSGKDFHFKTEHCLTGLGSQMLEGLCNASHAYANPAAHVDPSNDEDFKGAPETASLMAHGRKASSELAEAVAGMTCACSISTAGASLYVQLSLVRIVSARSSSPC